jgi:hypothetical protein
MKTNLPVWDYYNKDFVDPLYAPYQRHRVPGIPFPINTTVNQGCPAQVAPGLVRVGWNTSFQRKHASYPLPRGFTDGNGEIAKQSGWAYPAKPESVPVFYTSSWPSAVNKYKNGYTTGRYVPRTFSVSGSGHGPSAATGGNAVSKYWTGSTTNHGQSPPYGKYPTRHSYLVDAE